MATRSILTLVAVGLAAITLAGAGTAGAGEADGVWVVNDGQARVKVDSCGANLCGVVVWVADPIDPETGKPRLDRHNPKPALRSRPILGLRLFELQPDGASQWRGQIYNSKDGKDYDITLKTEGNALAIQGCILGSILCRTQSWPRFGG